MEVATEGRPWRVEVLPNGENKWVANGVRFPTAEQAAKYGADLFSRWTGIKAYQVVNEDGTKYSHN